MTIVAVVVAVVSAGCGASTPALSEPAQRGLDLTRQLGCAACHDSGDGQIGPAWSGSWGEMVALEDGGTVRFDASYVVTSIRHPDAVRRVGDWRRMPAFGPDQLSDDEIADIVAYLEELE